MKLEYYLVTSGYNKTVYNLIYKEAVLRTCADPVASSYSDVMAHFSNIVYKK